MDIMFDIVIIVYMFAWFYTIQCSKDTDIFIYGPDGEDLLPENWFVEKRSSKFCNQSLYEATTVLKPCGDKDVFQMVHKNVQLPEFIYQSFGGCDAVLENQKHEWTYFKRGCHSYGGLLASLYSSIIFKHYKKMLGRQGSEKIYWVGGRREVGETRHKWLPAEPWLRSLAVLDKQFVADKVNTNDPSCLFLNASGLYGDYCDMKYNAICRVADVKAYSPVLTISRRRQQSEDLLVGEKITVKCDMAFFDNSSFSLVIETNQGPVGWNSSLGQTGDKRLLLVSNHTYESFFQFFGFRCVAWYKLTLQITVTLVLSNATVKCILVRPVDRYPHASPPTNAFDNIILRPLKPVVKRDPGGLLKEEQTTDYTCMALLSTGIDSAGLTVATHKAQWGKSFSLDSKSNVFGEIPEWVHKVDFESGLNESWGLHYVKIIMNFTASLEIGPEMAISCHTGPVSIAPAKEYSYSQALEHIRTSKPDEYNLETLEIVPRFVKPLVNRVPGGLLQMGKIINYKCSATLPRGSNEAVLTLITQSSQWGRIFKLDKTHSDVGKIPTWVDTINFVSAMGVINITMTFTVRPAIGRGVTVGCYSGKQVAVVLTKKYNYTQVLKQIESTLDPDGYISEMLKVFYQVGGVRLRSRFPHETSATVYGCDRMAFTCIGWPGSENRILIFEVKLEGKVTTFTSEGKSTNMEDFLSFETRELMDYTQGPVLIVVFTPKHGWQKKTVVLYEGFSCVMTGKPEYREEIVAHLKFKYGNTPPIFDTDIEGNEGEETALHGSCTSFVGLDVAMTYELYDQEGTRFYWLVDEKGNIEGEIFFPWFQIQFVSDGWDENCGNVIRTMVNVTLSEHQKGWTLICYSLNVDGNFTSYYNKSELGARVELRGGGVIRVYQTNDEHTAERKTSNATQIISLLILLIALAIMTMLMMWICAKRRRRDDLPVEPEARTDEVDEAEVESTSATTVTSSPTITTVKATSSASVNVPSDDS